MLAKYNFHVFPHSHENRAEKYIALVHNVVKFCKDLNKGRGRPIIDKTEKNQRRCMENFVKFSLHAVKSWKTSLHHVKFWQTSLHFIET